MARSTHRSTGLKKIIEMLKTSDLDIRMVVLAKTKFNMAHISCFKVFHKSVSSYKFLLHTAVMLYRQDA